MKLSDYIIVIVILISSVAIPFTINQKKMIRSESLKITYNEIIDNSVKDASKALLSPMNNESIEILSEGKKVNFKKTTLNLDKALWRFYQSLYLNLNIEDDFSGQESIKNKIPIKLAVGYDGYYINSWQEIVEGKKIKEIWHPKTPYLIFDEKNNLNISLTLDNTVYISGKDKEEKEYKAEDLIGKIDNSLFNKDIENFNIVKKQIILNQIQKDLELYSSINNQIAIKNGWGYTLKLPLLDGRAINDISFIAFIQGKALNGVDLYNTYALGIARVVREKYIYGNEDNKTKVKYYHNEKCNEKDYNTIFDSEKDAAREGYHPHGCIK